MKTFKTRQDRRGMMGLRDGRRATAARPWGGFALHASAGLSGDGLAPTTLHGNAGTAPAAQEVHAR